MTHAERQRRYREARRARTAAKPWTDPERRFAALAAAALALGGPGLAAELAAASAALLAPPGPARAEAEAAILAAVLGAAADGGLAEPPPEGAA
jgi:hypothetical protein